MQTFSTNHLQSQAKPGKMKPSRPYNYFVCFIFLIELCGADIALEGEESISVWCDETVLNLIVSKLEEINKKVDLLDTKVSNTNPNSKSSNIERLVADSIKAYHTQTILETMSQTVKEMRETQLEQRFYLEKQLTAVNRTLHEEIINQANAQRYHIDRVTSTHNVQQTNVPSTNVKFPNQINSNVAAVITSRLDVEFEHLTVLVNGNQNQLKKIETQIESLKSINPTFESKLEADNRKITLLLNGNNDKLHSVETQVKQGFESNKQQLTSLQEFVQIATPKINSLANALPNLQKNSQASRCDLTKTDLQSEVQRLETKISSVTEAINTIDDKISAYPNCEKAMKANGKSGAYRLHVPYSGIKPFDAQCTVDLDGGTGWTVIQWRKDGTESFYRDWYAYKNGFGNPNGEHWIGLQKIFILTSQRKHELYITMTDHENVQRYARYSVFEIGNESEKYYLKTVGKYTGDAGDSLGAANKTRRFTTYDEDNDEDSTRNCAKRFLGAWWFNTCNWSSLNGEYNNTKSGEGINWYQWHGYEYSLKSVYMSIRPIE